jgi:hypothetical protein
MENRSSLLAAVAVALPLALLASGRATAAETNAPQPENVSHRRPNVLFAPERPTGLVIDARGLILNRAMGPRILDEDGNVLYPDPKNVPEMSVLQDRGSPVRRPPRSAALTSGSAF